MQKRRGARDPEVTQSDCDLDTFLFHIRTQQLSQRQMPSPKHLKQLLTSFSANSVPLSPTASRDSAKQANTAATFTSTQFATKSKKTGENQSPVPPLAKSHPPNQDPNSAGLGFTPRKLITPTSGAPTLNPSPKLPGTPTASGPQHPNLKVRITNRSSPTTSAASSPTLTQPLTPPFPHQSVTAGAPPFSMPLQSSGGLSSSPSRQAITRPRNTTFSAPSNSVPQSPPSSLSHSQSIPDYSLTSTSPPPPPGFLGIHPKLSSPRTAARLALHMTTAGFATDIKYE